MHSLYRFHSNNVELLRLNLPQHRAYNAGSIQPQDLSDCQKTTTDKEKQCVLENADRFKWFFRVRQNRLPEISRQHAYVLCLPKGQWDGCVTPAYSDYSERDLFCEYPGSLIPNAG